MTHAEVRCDERLTDIEKNAVMTAASAFVDLHPTGDHALRIATLGYIRGEVWSDISNGDMIIAIIRRGAIRTIMLRRNTQPFTRENLRVDKCWTLRWS